MFNKLTRYVLDKIFLVLLNSEIKGTEDVYYFQKLSKLKILYVGLKNTEDRELIVNEISKTMLTKNSNVYDI
jgi:hypothetical protein